MKAIVLAGGHATRLWPVTKDRAKPLLPLGDRPIIDFIVEELEEEVDDIIVSTNEKFASDFEKYIEDFEREARVVVENQGSEEEKPGTIGAIIQLIEKEGIDEDLLIVNGDNYLGFSFSELLEFCRHKEAPVNVVYDLERLEMASSFGVVDVNGDRIVDFEEKPEEPPSTLISTGVYFFPSHRVSMFKQYEEHFKDSEVPADEYLDEPGRLLEWGKDQAEIFAFSFDGDWFDVGTPEGYLEALDAVMDGNIVHGETDGCDIGENVLVLQNAELENVVIENSIVFPETRIKDSEVRNSLVDSHSEVVDADINDAILGKHTSM